MVREIQKSRVLEKAQSRAAGLKEIDPNIDFGNGRSLKSLTELIEKLRNEINAYNKTLPLIDTLRTEMKELDKELNSLLETMLMGVAFRYGKDSCEYMMAGGVRTSDRIRKSRKTRLKRAAQKKAAQSNQTT
ncbi:hypothetical protein H6G93_05505 [Nostoc sp. FACHB-973]|uniref:ATPase involved in DNA repair n=1 Tax=Desmonostoc muscorum LEGE 12446 TaxID=1828758 RepID=A0A8J7DHQ5_DESMC|nr:hypothetical protein [Desmonostoc muscorum]MBD2514469.1 hypothetical protein [Nostoc sp. FACHB-973]MBX9255301.1 hypothetical protein [Desmonostoc muscorum CCALA 125]MCF2150230.1 hypothetical protein [Desmonostoc muscorum LEGE 12446]